MTIASSEERILCFPRVSTLLGWTVLVSVLAWSYAAPISGLVHRWRTEPDYQHGFLVPCFAIFLLCYRARLYPTLLGPLPTRGSWWGLLPLGLCGIMRLVSGYWGYALLDPLSIVPCLAGVALLVGGWQALRWSWPAIVFLVFMVPLPGTIAGMMSHPLQRMGTVAGTYALQTLGVTAVAQGNVILLTDAQLGVVEACSGMRMMMLFLTVCAGAALVMRQGVLERLIVVLSAAPIAILANVVRITVTGLLYEITNHKLAEVFFHDLAGMFMMPLAVVLLWGEIALLGKILIRTRPEDGLAVTTTSVTQPVGGEP